MVTEKSNLKGLTIFHRVTIGCGIGFCLLITWRFGAAWWAFRQSVDLLMAIGGLAAACGFLAYFVSFVRRGI